jgi:hypothetical protein
MVKKDDIKKRRLRKIVERKEQTKIKNNNRLKGTQEKYMLEFFLSRV